MYYLPYYPIQTSTQEKHVPTVGFYESYLLQRPTAPAIHAGLRVPGEISLLLAVHAAILDLLDTGTLWTLASIYTFIIRIEVFSLQT